MQNLLVVAMLHGEGDLREPVEELVLGHVVLAALPVDSLKALLDLALEVTIVSVVHHDAQLALLGLVHFAETHDVGVVEDFEDFGLVQRLPSLFLAHLCDVDLLDDSEAVVGEALDEVGCAKGANSKRAHFLVSLK